MSIRFPICGRTLRQLKADALSRQFGCGSPVVLSREETSSEEGRNEFEQAVCSQDTCFRFADNRIASLGMLGLVLPEDDLVFGRLSVGRLRREREILFHVHHGASIALQFACD
jgi:hypothetical protein